MQPVLHRLCNTQRRNLTMGARITCPCLIHWTKGKGTGESVDVFLWHVRYGKTATRLAEAMINAHYVWANTDKMSKIQLLSTHWDRLIKTNYRKSLRMGQADQDTLYLISAKCDTLIKTNYIYSLQTGTGRSRQIIFSLCEWYTPIKTSYI